MRFRWLIVSTKSFFNVRCCILNQQWMVATKIESSSTKYILAIFLFYIGICSLKDSIFYLYFFHSDKFGSKYFVLFKADFFKFECLTYDICMVQYINWNILCLLSLDDHSTLNFIRELDIKNEILFECYH